MVDDYARFWFGGGGFRKQYTFWGAYALWQRSLVLDSSLTQAAHALYIYAPLATSTQTHVNTRDLRRRRTAHFHFHFHFP